MKTKRTEPGHPTQPHFAQNLRGFEWRQDPNKNWALPMAKCLNLYFKHTLYFWFVVNTDATNAWTYHRVSNIQSGTTCTRVTCQTTFSFVPQWWLTTVCTVWPWKPINYLFHSQADDSVHSSSSNQCIVSQTVHLQSLCQVQQFGIPSWNISRDPPLPLIS